MSSSTHASILDRLLEPVGKSMTVGLARDLSELRASPEVQARIDELADKCTEGALSDAERSEYDSYIHAIYLIGFLQRKAKAFLKNHGPVA